MKRAKRIIFPLLLMLLISVSLTCPAFAITESEVEAQVASAGKEAVAGNVLIWFLCAVAFLKVSQKVDSFLSSLGVNVGHTGGSMLSDAMIAMRAVKAATGSHGGPRAGSTSGPASSGPAGPTGFFQGGLAGIVSRKVTSDAIRTATTQTSTVQSATASKVSKAEHSASEIRSDSTAHTGSETHSDSAVHTNTPGQPGSIIHTEESERSDSTVLTGSPVDSPVPGMNVSHNVSHTDSFSQSEGIIQTDNTPISGDVSLPGGNADPLSPAEPGMVENVRPDEAIQTDNTPIPYSPAPSDERVEPSAPVDTRAVDTQPVDVRSADAIPADGGQSDGIIQTDNSPIPPGPDPAGVDTPVPAPISPDPAGPIPIGSKPQEGIIQTDNTPAPEQLIHTNSETYGTSDTESVSAVYTSGTVHTDNSRSSETTIPSTDTHDQSHTSQHTTVEHSTHTHVSTAPDIPHVPSLGGMMFMRSLQSGGRFANDVIGTIARGDTRTAGTMTGDLAAQALTSYMSIPSPGEKAVEKVTYSQVEIGGGKIMGKEVTPEHPSGIAFSMYHVDQYAEPKSLYEKVTTVDGAQWYKQVAVDTLVKTPSKIVDGKVEYNQEIVKRLPDPPRRKDKI